MVSNLETGGKIMRKENWLVLAWVDMIRVFGQFIRQVYLVIQPIA